MLAAVARRVHEWFERAGACGVRWGIVLLGAHNKGSGDDDRDIVSLALQSSRIAASPWEKG